MIVMAGTLFIHNWKKAMVLYKPLWSDNVWLCIYAGTNNAFYEYEEAIREGIKLMEEKKSKNKMNFEYKFYEKNLAPKWLEGDYDLHIEGNKMVMSSKDGIEVKTRCHPDDDWRLQVGLDELKERMAEVKKPKIEKGCIVKPMDRYRYYLPDDVCDFFHDSNIPMEDILNTVRAQLQNCRPSVAFKYYVKKVGWHTDEKTGEKREVALIKSMETPYEYIVDVADLELVE